MIVLVLVVGENAIDPLTDPRPIRVPHLAPARVPQRRSEARGPSNRLLQLPDRQEPRLAGQLRLRHLDFDRPLRREIDDQRQHTLSTPARPPRGVEVLMSQRLLRPRGPFHWSRMNNAG